MRDGGAYSAFASRVLRQTARSTSVTRTPSTVSGRPGLRPPRRGRAATAPTRSPPATRPSAPDRQVRRRGPARPAPAPGRSSRTRTMRLRDAAAMLHARDDLLADIAALGEIDAVAAGPYWRRAGTRRHRRNRRRPAATPSAMRRRVVGRAGGRRRRRARPRAGDDRRAPRPGARGSAGSPSRLDDDGERARCASAIVDLGAQLVEARAAWRGRRPCRRARRAGTSAASRAEDEEIEQDLALRRQQRGVARLRPARALSTSLVRGAAGSAAASGPATCTTPRSSSQTSLTPRNSRLRQTPGLELDRIQPPDKD